MHGFIYSRGERLSKSLGNLVDPVEVASDYGADELRFYLLDAIPTGRDGEFTFRQFVEHCNTRLANGLGNLASRTLKIVHSHFEGKTPPDWAPDGLRDPEARAALEALIAAAAAAHQQLPVAFDEFRIHDALEAAWAPVVKADEFIERVKPWEAVKDPARRAEVGTAMNAVLEVLRLAALWAWPAIPTKAETLWAMLGLSGSPGTVRGEEAAPRFGAPATRALGLQQSLFPRLKLPTGADSGDGNAADSAAAESPRGAEEKPGAAPGKPAKRAPGKTARAS